MVKKYFFLILLLLNFLYGIEDLKPTAVYTASGGVTNIVVRHDKIYVSTSASSVDIFDKTNHKLIKQIKVPQIKDFMGDIIDAKIYNADVSDNGNILMTVQDTSGFRELYLYNGQKNIKLISAKDKIYISKSLFLDDNHILFCSLGNVMYLFDISNKKIVWNIDIKAPQAEFNSTFADFVLSKDKKLAVVADESGDIKIVDIKSKTVIDVLSGKNLDKVFKVDIKQNKIITAGQDRRCVVYNLQNKSSYYFTTDFLIYAAALSPNGRYGAYSNDEQNNVIVFDTNSKQKLFRLTQNLMTMSSMTFTSNNEIFIGTDSNKFNYYQLKGLK